MIKKIFRARFPVNNIWNNDLPQIIAFRRICAEKEIMAPGYHSRKYGTHKMYLKGSTLGHEAYWGQLLF